MAYSLQLNIYITIFSQKEKQPFKLITAHMGEINGLDWSYTNPNELITCSQDKQVKVFLAYLNKRKKLRNNITRHIALGCHRPAKGTGCIASGSPCIPGILYGMDDECGYKYVF